MNVISERTLYIGRWLPEQNSATPAALWKSQRDGVRESGDFAYGLAYLDKTNALPINPLHLPLQRAPTKTPTQLLRDGGAMPLTLKDALPDAWGRLVITRQFDGQHLSDIDLLLHTNDDRVGALVFSESLEMPVVFKAAAESPHPELSQLAEAARRIQYDLEITPELKRLLQQGGSLGGARPKASFTHENALWLAKFPAKGDPIDVQRLEAATQNLAKACGINGPTTFTLPINENDTAFVSRRFDRYGPGSCHRRHFLSASAMLNLPYESSDGSYLALAQAIRKVSASPRADLEELFRRMVFNVLIDNSDDHLKNHGFLEIEAGKYRLSPVFDVVPQLTNLGYQMLSIDGDTHIAHLELAVEAAAHFDLSQGQAVNEIKLIQQTINETWKVHAEAAKMSRVAQQQLESCLNRQAQKVSA